jgi:hypothetical protein
MIKKLAAAAITGGLVLGADTFAYAETGSSPSSSSTPSARVAGGAGLGRPGALLRRVEHGDLTIKTKNGTEQVTLDRGKVTAVSATSITIQPPDGQAVTIAIDTSTRFRGVDGAGSIKTGKPAIVVSKAGTAVIVAQRAGRAGKANA